MNVKKLLATGLIIGLVLIGVFFVFKDLLLNTNDERAYHISTTQETQSREEVIKRFDFYNKAIETLSEDMCESIVGDNDMRVRCSEEIYTAKAVKETDIHLCEKINNPSVVNSCKNNFYYKSALVSKAQDPCNNIVGDNGFKNICREGVLGGPRKEEAKNSDMEILISTMKTNDLKTCTSVSKKELQIKCSDDIYFRQAISENNPVICEKISNAIGKSQCIDNVNFIIEQEKK